MVHTHHCPQILQRNHQYQDELSTVHRVYSNITCCKHIVHLYTIYYLFSGPTCAYRTVLNFSDAKLQQIHLHRNY